jgi:hypothetical protein
MRHRNYAQRGERPSLPGSAGGQKSSGDKGMNRHLSEDEIAQWVSGSWLSEVERHLRECPPCAAEVAGAEEAFVLFRESGREWSDHWYRLSLTRPVPARLPARRLAFAMTACTAVCVLLGVLLLRPVPPPEEPFLEIPYVAPLAPYERAEIVRMDVPVSELAAEGLEVHVPDTSATVLADVVLGQDGRAHAIRLVSDANRSVTQ